MKLKKREITLNEVDSLKDMLYLENLIAGAYGEGDENAFRRETTNELQTLGKELAGERALVEKLFKRAKAEQLV